MEFATLILTVIILAVAALGIRFVEHEIRLIRRILATMDCRLELIEVKLRGGNVSAEEIAALTEKLKSHTKQLADAVAAATTKPSP